MGVSPGARHVVRVGEYRSREQRLGVRVELDQVKQVAGRQRLQCTVDRRPGLLNGFAMHRTGCIDDDNQFPRQHLHLFDRWRQKHQQCIVLPLPLLGEHQQVGLCAAGRPPAQFEIMIHRRITAIDEYADFAGAAIDVQYVRAAADFLRPAIAKQPYFDVRGRCQQTADIRCIQTILLGIEYKRNRAQAGGQWPRQIYSVCGRSKPRHHRHRQTYRIFAVAIIERFQVRKPDRDFFTGPDIRQGKREKIGALLLDDTGTSPLAPGLLIFAARRLLFLDLPFDRALADGNQQPVHRRAIGQREKIAPFDPLVTRVDKMLRDLDPRDRPADRRCHLVRYRRCDKRIVLAAQQQRASTGIV